MKGHSDTASLWGSLVAFAGWFISHLADINLLLQFLVLIIALVSGAWGLWRLWKHRHR